MYADEPGPRHGGPSGPERAQTFLHHQLYNLQGLVYVCLVYAIVGYHPHLGIVGVMPQ